MTPEKMRALQVRIDELEANNKRLVEYSTEMEEAYAETIASLRTCKNALKRAKAEIKKLKG